MQSLLPLLTFEYEDRQTIRTVTINGEPWFYAMDVGKALQISNSRDSVSRLDPDDVGTTDGIDSMGRTQKYTVINESGLYQLVFESRAAGAKKFKRWVTSEVLPKLRKTGSFSIGGQAALPAFIRRFNDNWDRIDQGYFSIISELAIRVYGRFEQVGHIIADTAPNGKEIRPDVSVGKCFSNWLKKEHPEVKDKFKTYKHLIGGKEVDARQYPNEMLPLYLDYIDKIWMRDYAPAYLAERDPIALELLPKLLPPPDKNQQVVDVGVSKLNLLKDKLIGEIQDEKKKKK